MSKTLVRRPARLLTIMSLLATAALALSGLAAASASAGVHWSSCQKVGVGTGTYEDARCTKPLSGGAYAWTSLGTGSQQNFRTEGTTPYKLLWEWGGITLENQCSSEFGTVGLIENQLGGLGEEARLTNSVWTFAGCKVTKPAGEGCKLRGEKVVTNPIGGRAVQGTGEKSELRISPPASGTFFEEIYEGCSPSTLNGTYAVGGNMNAIYKSPGMLEFTPSSTRDLTQAGHVSSIIGTSAIVARNGNTGPFFPLQLGL